MAFLLLAAVRFGPAGASGAMAIMTALSIAAMTTAPPGAHLRPEFTSVLSLQLFLIVIGIPIMSLSVLMEQQRKTEHSLRESEARLAKLNSEQQQNMAEITALNERLITAEENERRRIGREMHDDLNQQVAVLGINVSGVKRKLAAGLADRNTIADIESGLLQLSSSIHALSHELHPAFLERTGLGPALKTHCEEFTAVNQIDAHVTIEGPVNVPVDLALCLYRIAQEALRNAAKHSGAKEVWVSLAGVDGRIHLTIEDSGRGFDAQAVRGNGIGLASMKDRVRIAGGTIEFGSRVGGGAVTRVVAPLPAASAASGG